MDGQKADFHEMELWSMLDAILEQIGLLFNDYFMLNKS